MTTQRLTRQFVLLRALRWLMARQTAYDKLLDEQQKLAPDLAGVGGQVGRGDLTERGAPVLHDGPTCGRGREHQAHALSGQVDR